MPCLWHLYPWSCSAGLTCLVLQDIPANLKAAHEPEGSSYSTMPHQQMHRKELKLKPMQHNLNPLGYYFQEDAHKGGLTGAVAGDAIEGAGPDD